ncbi:MAG: hypothetical protein FWG59_00475 [Betaproteobacteria bacterium]|nr:hypothetical protein [Desulfovibrionaceae bacterium]MCL1984909.1 hypothetical protein [Betaproteobacteria bacterium]
MDLPVENKLKLMKEQHKFTMIEKTNEFSMAYAKLSLNACLLLNGAAATALLSTKDVKLYWAAAILGLGALAGVLALGVAYWYTMALLESWRHTSEEPDKPYIPVFWPCKGRILITYEQLEKYRWVPIAFFIVSLFLFLIGLGVAVRYV